MAGITDIRAGDTIIDTADRARAYYVEATDSPSIGWLTVVSFDPFDPDDAYAEEWVTAHALALVAGGRFVVAARRVALPHIDRKEVA